MFPSETRRQVSALSIKSSMLSCKYKSTYQEPPGARASCLGTGRSKEKIKMWRRDSKRKGQSRKETERTGEKA